MRQVYIELLTTHSEGRINTADLANVAIAINKGTTMYVSSPDSNTTDAERVSKRQGREFAYGFCDTLRKVSVKDGLSFLFPNGTKITYASDIEATADVANNFATYYPDIIGTVVAP